MCSAENTPLRKALICQPALAGLPGGAGRALPAPERSPCTHRRLDGLFVSSPHQDEFLLLLFLKLLLKI